MRTRWLNIWNFGTTKRYWLSHPIKWVKRVVRAFKWLHQRATQGYCDGDWYNTGKWFTDIMPQMLRDMANKGGSYPIETFGSPEVWHIWLNKIADKLELATDEYRFSEEANEYTDDFLLLSAAAKERELTPQEKILRNKYFSRQKELAAEQDETFKEVMNELILHWNDLWD